MEVLPYVLNFSSLSASRSSSHPKSARLRLLFARAGMSPYVLFLISWSAFARVRVLVLGFRIINDVDAADSSGGAPVGIRTLTSAACGLLSFRRGPSPPKSSFGSVFSMP